MSLNETPKYITYSKTDVALISEKNGGGEFGIQLYSREISLLLVKTTADLLFDI